VGLAERLDHQPHQLSGGQQQRVAIARALVGQPQILFADEPTGNLDTKTGAAVMNAFAELERDGLTIILVTHEPDIAERAARTITLRDGVIASDQRRERRAS
jgi:putative ABC transport system ATP-binding protein